MEFALFMATFLVTLNFSMVPGIITGVVLSILILLYRAAYPHIAILGRLTGLTEFRNVKRFKELELWEDTCILRVDAPLTFINIQFVKEFIEERVEKHSEVNRVLLDASAISHIDASATQGLSDLVQTLDEKQVEVMIAGLVGPVRDSLHKTGLLQEIGEEHIFLTLNDALESLGQEESYAHREKALQHGQLSR